MKSIKTKILLIVCLLVTISLTCVGATVSVLMYRSSLTTLEQTMGETASIAGDLVIEYLETYKSVATEAGLVARLTNPEVSNADKRALLDSKIKQYGFLGGNIVDANGISPLSELNIADRDYFKKAIAGETTASEIVFGRTSGKYTINVAAPLHEGGLVDGKIVGVVFFNVDANALSNITNSIQIGKTGGAYMLDKDNYTIAHKTIKVDERDNTKEALADNPALQALADIEAAMTRGEEGFGIYNYKGVSKLMAYAPVDNGLGWSIAVNAELDEFVSSTYQVILITVVLTTIAIIIGLLISIWLANSIAKPIKEIESAALALSEGNLGAKIHYTSRDEVGRLAESMRSSMRTLKTYVNDIDKAAGLMAVGNFVLDPPTLPFVGDFASIETSFVGLSSHMSDTLSQIKTASNQVSSGSEQVSSGAQALSEGATEQASAIEELSASIAEISQQVKNTANNANLAREQAGQAGVSVQDSNEQMHKMIAAMNDISQKSSDIGKIIKTIDDIAFQTNILALNAAVEAARAGAAGKGFAVVADEVRNLSGKSAEAAKNTTALIEETVAAVVNGTKIAGNTAQAMTGVVTGTNAVSNLIAQIADASDEQANSITQVTLGIDQISSVVQTNSATSEESAAASEELNSQAQLLKELVGRFTISEDQHLPLF